MLQQVMCSEDIRVPFGQQDPRKGRDGGPRLCWASGEGSVWSSRGLAPMASETASGPTCSERGCQGRQTGGWKTTTRKFLNCTAGLYPAALGLDAG